MIPNELRNQLARENQPDNIKQLLDHLNKWLRSSRSDMSKQYRHWDRNIRVYRGQIPKDADDYEARQMVEPERFIMPLSYAQVQTFVAFAFLLLTQNEPFYQFSPSSDDDYGMLDTVEKCLKRDLLVNSFASKLYQFLLDVARCGMGVFNCYWTKETQWVQIPGQMGLDMVGPYSMPNSVPASMKVECTKYEGNKIQCINVYRFLPDTRLPLTRWKDGQFVADEEEWHIEQLKEYERQGLMVGTKWISPMQRRLFTQRGPGRFWRMENSFVANAKDPTDFMVILTQVQVKLVPKDFGLGPEDYPILHLVRIANDNRILSIEPAEYLHGDFTYIVGQLSPDNQSRINESVADVVHAIQDTITWLINSRIASVRKTLDSHMILDPSKFEMESIKSRSPFIFLKKNAATIGVDKFFKQLDVRDTTQSHMTDADTLMKLMQFITGINDNAMGQFSGGRRSATEARAVNAGAASRMKIPVVMLWADALGPMGRQMMSNQRQGFSFETFSKIVGPKNQYLQPMFQWYCPDDPRELVGNQDFFTLDATLQSEKGFVAQSLQELFIACVQNPEFNQMFDLEEMLTEIQTLRGVTNVSRFILPQYRRNPAAEILGNQGSLPGQAPPMGGGMSPGGGMVPGQPGAPALPRPAPGYIGNGGSASGGTTPNPS